MSEINEENASLLKELAAYADQVLLTTIKDAMSTEFMDDKNATLEICHALLLDLVAVTRRMNTEDPMLRIMGNRAHMVLYEQKQHLKLLQKYRSSYKVQIEKTNTQRGQLQARDRQITDLTAELENEKSIKILNGTAHYHDIVPGAFPVNDCAACIESMRPDENTLRIEVPASLSQAPELIIHDMDQFSDEDIRLHDDDFSDSWGMRTGMSQIEALQAHFLKKCQICKIRQGGPSSGS